VRGNVVISPTFVFIAYREEGYLIPRTATFAPFHIILLLFSPLFEMTDLSVARRKKEG